MLTREDLLTGLARAAMTVRADNGDNDGELTSFVAFMASAEENLALIRNMLQRSMELDAAGNVDDAAAMRHQLFSTVMGFAVIALSMASHFPWLKRIEVPENLRELWGMDEVKH